MSQEFHVRIGGLFRCCLATLEAEAKENKLPTQIGATLACRWCKQDSPTLRLAADNIWEWNQLKS